jgi:hypothetical protein
MNRIALTALLAFTTLSCADDDIVKTPLETGTVHLTVSYDGEVPEGAKITGAVMACPFTMPPIMVPPPAFAVQTFPAEGDFADVPAGEHCIYVYMDVDPTDGVVPVPGVDNVNLLPEGAESFPVTITAGEVTNLDIELVNTESGAADGVSVDVTIECEICDNETPLRFYGSIGEAIGLPNYYHEIENPIFPLHLTLDASTLVTGTEVPWATGTTTFQAYQDTTPGGHLPEDGEPVSEALILDLQPGANTFTLRLE